MDTQMGGKPMTDDDVSRLLAMVAKGAFPSRAAARLGFTRQAVTMRKKRDPEFAAALDKADADGEEYVVGPIRDNDTWQARAWYAQRRWRVRWSTLVEAATALSKQKDGKPADGAASLAKLYAEAIRSLPIPYFAAPTGVPAPRPLAALEAEPETEDNGTAV